MTLVINNNSDKAIIIRNESFELYLEPYDCKEIETSDYRRLEVYKSKANSSFFNRLKREVSLNEINIRQLKFGLKYSSYLKTILFLKFFRGNKLYLNIKESEYENSSMFCLHCFEIGNQECVENSIYTFFDKTQNILVQLYSAITLFLNYGIISLVAIIFDLGLILSWDETLKNDTNSLFIAVTAATLFTTFPILLVVNSIKTHRLIGMLKKNKMVGIDYDSLS